MTRTWMALLVGLVGLGVSLGCEADEPAPVRVSNKAPVTHAPGTYEVTTLVGSTAYFSEMGAVLPITCGGMAVDRHDNLYLQNAQTYSVIKITPDGQMTAVATSSGPVAVDADDNLYVAMGSSIQRVSPAGDITNLAGGASGFADGAGDRARFSDIRAMTLDQQGNLYVAERANKAVRKVTPAGVVTTVAGHPGFDTPFESLVGIARDAAGNVYVTESLTASIRKISPSGQVSTFAGGSAGFQDGVGTAARFSQPAGLAIDAEGTLYLADKGNYAIRKIEPDGTVTTVVGRTWGFADGAAAAARFSTPFALALDQVGDLFVADSENHAIRQISPTKSVATLRRPFSEPAGILGLPGGDLCVADSSANYLLRVDPTGKFFAWSGSDKGLRDAVGTAARYLGPTFLVRDANQSLYVADTSNHAIRRVTPDGQVTTVAGGTPGNVDDLGKAARFKQPKGLAVDSLGTVCVADFGNNAIRTISPEGSVSTLVGGTPGFVDGTGTAAAFDGPVGLARDEAGVLYVADSRNNSIRKITPSGLVSTIAGGQTPGNADGPGSAARFDDPQGIALDALGNLYVADAGNHSIRLITPAGVVSTIAGGTRGTRDGIGREAQFDRPTGIWVDESNRIYVSDPGAGSIRVIN